ncbi:uncharacterized protein [Drosophila tropicalis]|uniref:uncharacterized protein n=1 Tax=Drosophila tropicalis TaxID=46794 RepID=UPI0035AB8C2C
MERVRIEHLRSYMELNGQDRQRCYDRFYNERLEEKNKDNKYLKRTSYIFEQGNSENLDNECFLTFDLIPVHKRYSALIFSLCGITSHFHYILFLGVLEDAKMDSLTHFVGEILANLLITEIPKLPNFPLKFVLLRNDLTSQNVLKIFAESKKTLSLFNNFLFINDSSAWRLLSLHDPYAQSAWDEIMLSYINDENLDEIFGKYFDLAAAKGNDGFKEFISDFQNLAKKLLMARSVISFRLCTLERLDIFEKIITAHVKGFKEQRVNRMVIFQLLRALILIYGH